jgi:hypothetical protein
LDTSIGVKYFEVLCNNYYPSFSLCLSGFSVLLLIYNEISLVNNDERMNITNLLTQISSQKRKAYFYHEFKKSFFGLGVYVLKPYFRGT